MRVAGTGLPSSGSGAIATGPGLRISTRSTVPCTGIPTACVIHMLGFARDVMRTRIPTVAPADSLARALDIMCSFSIRELPVVGNGAIAGILARSDLEPYVGQFEWTPVRIAMSTPIRTVPPEAPIRDVALALLDGTFNGIPVAVGSVLAGMITRSDLVRLLIEL